MDVVIERLGKHPANWRIDSAHQVWLPPLPQQLSFSSVLQQAGHAHLDGRKFDPKSTSLWHGSVRPIGLLDNPQEQSAGAISARFFWCGWASGAGWCTTGGQEYLLAYAGDLIFAHSYAAYVQIYAIDLGGGLLRVFERVPHVGAVCSKAEREKIRRTVRQMRKVVEDREYLFREHGIDSMSDVSCTARERRVCRLSLWRCLSRH